jgi:hypothetical protein
MLMAYCEAMNYSHPSELGRSGAVAVKTATTATNSPTYVSEKGLKEKTAG